MDPTAESVLHFWFGDDQESPEAIGLLAGRWFGGGPSFDAEIRDRFEGLPPAGLRGELDDWLREPRSLLALILVLDQFPRNLYRESAQSFAHDARALEIARGAVDRGVDAKLTPLEATFLYLPFEHAEDREDQRRCVALFGQLASRSAEPLRPQVESFLAYAEQHQVVIERFGRFPHRNKSLGRPSTPDEIAYLESGGQTFGASDEDS